MSNSNESNQVVEEKLTGYAINKRKIGICILLSFVTFGIYLIYWKYLLVKNTRELKNNRSSCVGEMLCLIFVPFYSLYWWFTRGKTVKNVFTESGYHAAGNSILYLILGIFGLEIVSMAIMQNDFNSLKTDTVKSSQENSGGKKKKYSSQSRNRRVSLAVTYAILIILAIIWIIPLLWIFLSAFRCEYQDGTFIGRVTSSFFPRAIGLESFKRLFAPWNYPDINYNFHFARWMLNTLIISVIDCVISTLLVLSVAYCMSKLKFKLRKTFMNISMILGLFPGFMSMIAIYFLLKSVGLTGNPDHPELSLVGLVLAYSAGAGLGFQIAKGFFDVIPNALVESAKLDGCTNFKVFWKIILPLAKPIIIYQALMSFTGPWMDFIFAKVIIGAANEEYWTVSVGLYSMLYGTYADTNLFTVFAAGCVLVAIPIVTLFMFLQKYYVEGVTAGAVKG